LKEIDDSLHRLDCDYIDIYQVHWNDKNVPCEETAELLNTLREKGNIKAIGTSNFSAEQMDRFRKEAPLHTNQPPYNLFERGIEEEVLPYCKANGIATLSYGAICRGLLSGKMTEDTVFEGDDIRRIDPKFKAKNRKNYLNAVSALNNYAKEKYGKTVLELSVRWILDMNIETALWGARKPAQLDSLEGIFGWNLNEDDKTEIDEIINKYIPERIGAEFMAPGE
jgi:aryl-alcohol dehydrogenase-like predicted oxidoreductase